MAMTVQGLVWLLVALMKASAASSSGLVFLLIIPWYLPLVAAYLMRPTPEAGDSATPESPGASS